DASGFGVRRDARSRKHMPFRRKSTLLLQFGGAIACGPREDVAGGLMRVRRGPCQGPLDGGLNVAAPLLRKRAPLDFAEHTRYEVPVQTPERIARPLASDGLRRLVGLRILSGVAGQARHRQAQ